MATALGPDSRNAGIEMTELEGSARDVEPLSKV
jgi:hypothetical protein